MADRLRQDITIAIRALRREPGVTAVALLSFAIGIAANATVFSLVQAVEFPRLIYPDASRIVFIESRNPGRNLSELPISAPDGVDLAASVRALGVAALAADDSVTVREAATPAHWAVRQVTPAFFDVMRVGATQGHVLAAGDEDRAVVLGDRFWRTQLGADPAVVGRVIHVNDEPRTVAGVMPPHFDPDADFWMPLPDAVVSASSRSDRRFTTFARLADGATLDAANREIAGISARLAADHPETNTGWEMFATALTRMHGQDSHGAFLLMQGAVVFVLLIACANIANILLARGTRRGHEMAVRVALGASRRRLVRHLLTESLLLAAAGGVLGVLLTMWGIRLARSLYAFPETIDPELTAAVLAFAAGVSVLTGLIAGTVPALRASRVAPQAALQSDGARAVAPAGRGRLRAVLVAVEVASAVVLAAGAGLLVQSLVNRQHVDLGFDASGAMRATPAPRRNGRRPQPSSRRCAAIGRSSPPVRPPGRCRRAWARSCV